MQIITKQDVLIKECKDCNEYHLISNEGMTKQTYIINNEETTKLKENLKKDIIYMLYDYEIKSDLLEELEENIKNIIDEW